MTNYFSRLARTTGLHFGAAPAPGREAPPLVKSGGGPPPHVEESAFVESEPAPVTPIGPTAREGHAQESARSQASAQEDSPAPARAGPPAELSVTLDERPGPGGRDADSRTTALFEESRVELVSQEEEHKARPPAAHERIGPPDRAPSAPGEASLNPTRGAQETEADPAREDAGRERLETLEVAEVAQLPDAPAADAKPAASPAAQSDARRAYLREVVEWITGPADALRELDGTGAVEPESSRPPESKAIGPAAVAPRVRAEEADELEVQDFSLSIGSISIVVEDEPKPAPAPAHRPEPERRQPAPVETSRLRRRYIGGL